MYSKKLNSRKSNLGDYTSIGNMTVSTTTYLDSETTVIIVFIYAKKIAYVNTDFATKFIKLAILLVNAPLNCYDDLKF